MPEKWRNAGEVVGDGFSIAWRVLEAKYWGCAARRKRVFTVVDFNGECAGKILFEQNESGDVFENFRKVRDTGDAGCNYAKIDRDGAWSINTQGAGGYEHELTTTRECTNALLATGDKPYVAYTGMDGETVIRYVTPQECAELQGFPRDWCAGIGIENPTEDDLEYWAGVWETHRAKISKNKNPKTEKQLRKWLQNPYTDGAEYRLWGNGVALPCVSFIIGAIKAGC